MARVRQEAATAARWTLEHGVMNAVFASQARAGDPMARIQRVPAVRDHPEAMWEEIRAAGPLRRGKYVWQTAHLAVGSAILRSDAVGVPVPSEDDMGRVGRLLERMRDDWALGPIDPPSLLALDGADHTRLRKLVSRAFTPRRVAGMTGDIEATAHKLLDRVGDRREFDLVEEYAAQLPLAVIADLLGVPADEQEPLLEWGNAGAMLLDAGLPLRTYRRSVRAMREMHTWFVPHIGRLRRTPGDDLLSSVITAADGLPAAEQPTATELRMLGLLVLGAGFETTVNLVGNAVNLLSEHRDQRDALVAAPTGWANAVEEVLRFDSPVQFNARAVRQPLDLTALGGRVLQPGAVVLILVGAMHRDPAVWDDPNTFDVMRANAGDHLAFSAGSHFCLGAGLARARGRDRAAGALRTLPHARRLGPGRASTHAGAPRLRAPAGARALSVVRPTW